MVFQFNESNMIRQSIHIGSNLVTKLSKPTTRNIKGIVNAHKLRIQEEVTYRNSKKYFQVYKTCGVTEIILTLSKIACIPRSPMETKSHSTKGYERIIVN